MTIQEASKEVCVALGPDDRICHTYFFYNRMVFTRIRVQYEVRIDNVYRPVVRFTVTDGLVRRETFNHDGQIVRNHLAPKSGTLADLYDMVARDVTAKWKRYRRDFQKGRKR